jgi:hypothetical protein
MSSIKQLIINAIIKVSGTNPALDREGEPTAIEARDMFIQALMAELFPEDPSVPVAAPQKAKKTKKTEKTIVTVEKTDVEVPADAAVEVPVVEVEAEPSPKKKRAPMSDEAKAAMKAKRDATLAAKKAGGEVVSPGTSDSILETSTDAAPAVAAEPVKEKKPRKPKVAEDANLAKVDSTFKKYLKAADKDHWKELEPELLAYLNAFSKEDFHAKGAEEHVADFIASRVTKAVADDGKVEADLVVVDFEGKEYYVNPETKRVYEGEGVFDEETGWTNYKPVGYVGMAAFEKMTLDE